LAVVPEVPLIPFILFPVDIAGVLFPDEHFPFFLRHTLYDTVTVHRLTGMGSAINESARISRVVEDT
jgi:hypothetical protein